MARFRKQLITNVALRIQTRRFLHKNPLKFVIFFLIGLYIIATAIIMTNENVSLLEAILITIPSFLGEMGSIEFSPTGIASMIGLLVYVAFLGILIGKAAEYLVSISFRGGVIMKKIRYKNHVLICGWNYQGPKIIENLLASNVQHKKPIVILADMENPPYSTSKVDFVRGAPYKKDDLIRAGIKNADSAIILTDMGKDNPDADALMITLAIESLNKDVHTCVQILSSENREHLKNANADEIICLDQVGGNLAVASALNYGVSGIINELLTFNLGSEFYRYKHKLPSKFIGKSFTEVGQQLYNENLILIAVETQEDEYLLEKCKQDWIHTFAKGRAILINPVGDYLFRENDILFVISEKEPVKI